MVSHICASSKKAKVPDCPNGFNKSRNGRENRDCHGPSLLEKSFSRPTPSAAFGSNFPGRGWKDPKVSSAEGVLNRREAGDVGENSHEATAEGEDLSSAGQSLAYGWHDITPPVWTPFPLEPKYSLGFRHRSWSDVTNMVDVVDDTTILDRRSSGEHSTSLRHDSIVAGPKPTRSFTYLMWRIHHMLSFSQPPQKLVDSLLEEFPQPKTYSVAQTLRLFLRHLYRSSLPTSLSKNNNLTALTALNFLSTITLTALVLPIHLILTHTLIIEQLRSCSVAAVISSI